MGKELSDTPSSLSPCSQRAHTTTQFCIEGIRSGGLTHSARWAGSKPKLPDSLVCGCSCHSHSMTGSWGGRVSSGQLPELSPVHGAAVCMGDVCVHVLVYMNTHI